MKEKDKTGIKAALVAVFMVLMMSFNGVASKNEEPKPVRLPETFDFAYPQTVCENAAAKLRVDLNKKDYVSALRDAIALTVAKNEISSGNAATQLALLDSLAGVMPVKYGCLAVLLEAQMYDEIYSNGRNRYNARVEPVSEEDNGIKADFLEWGFENFSVKIKELTDKALTLSETDRAIPLSEFKQLIAFSEEAGSIMDIAGGFTLYDFVVYKTIGLRQRFENQKREIPFFKNGGSDGKQEPTLRLIEDLIKFHSQPCDALSYAIIRKSRLLQENPASFLWENIWNYSDNSAVLPLVWEFNKLYNRDSEKRVVSEKGYYEKLCELKNKYASSRNIDVVTNILAELTGESVTLNWSTPNLSGNQVDIKYESKNCNDFYILVYRPLNKGGSERMPKLSELEKSYVLEKSIPVKIGSSVPFAVTDSVALTLSKPGYYPVVVSRSEKLKDAITSNLNYRPDFIHITDIHTVSVENGQRGRSSLFVVNASDGSPVSGSSVMLEYDYNKPKSVKYKTDKNGSITFNLDRYAKSIASYKGNEYIDYVYPVWESSESKEQTDVCLLTDLSIYKPGQEVGFCGVAYNHNSKSAKITEGFETTVNLLNPSGKVVASQKFTSDENGRFNGSFTLPENDRLGTWQICVNNNRWNSFTSFQVADYKAPNFFITISQKEGDSTDYCEFEGLVSTYSGMPMANVEVDYEISFRNWRPWLYVPSSTYGSTVRTDSEGKFKIVLPLEDIRDTDYRFGCFTLSASATSEAGETAFSNSLSFGISKEVQISMSIPSQINVDDNTLSLNVCVNDILGYPVRKELTYKLYRSGETTILKQGEFLSPNLTINASDLLSGRYKIEVFSPEEKLQPQTADFLIFRTADAIPAETTPLWVPVKSYISEPGEDNIDVIYGSSYRGQYILCVISSSNGEIERKWLKSNGKNEILKIKTPKENEKIFVNFIAIRDHKGFQEVVTITPKELTEELDISAVSFRDKITPGDEEKWQFEITLGGAPIGVPAMAVMSNRALDALQPFQWNGTIFRPSLYNRTYIRSLGLLFKNGYFNVPVKTKPAFIPDPLMWFDTYGMPLYSSYNEVLYSKQRMNFATKATATREGSNTAKEDMLYYEVAEDAAIETPKLAVSLAGAADEGVAEETAPGEDSVEIRDIEMPLAFFKPELKSSSNGKLNIDFTVPNYNTEWKLQIFAYTPDMKSTNRSFTTVASKKVMVQMTAPRFLRTGDNAVLTATLYNNSDTVQQIGGSYEIFDIQTNEIYFKKEFEPEAVEASGNRVISVTYHCPDNISALGLRAFARSGKSADGEQALIPVLPSSQPIIESTPFYLQPDTDEFRLKLPAFKDGDRVTFDYTDNPMWTVLTALPSLKMNESDNLLWNLGDFYADCVGYGLLKKHENLREGLREIISGEDRDSLLTSNLNRHADLKIVALQNTPWVNDAYNENLRLSKLGDLLNKDKAETAIRTAWNKIKGLQQPDGGWCWFNGGKSSVWLSTTVLLHLGMLKDAGYLYPEADSARKKEIDDVLAKGFRYCEREIYREIKESKNPAKYPYAGLKSFVLARSYFPELEKSSPYKEIETNVLDALAKEWKKTTVYEKATTAILFWRNNREGEAKSVLESLRQFASYEPSKGMWYDNLGSGYYGAGKLLTTANVLAAFHEIEPGNEAIDRLRQWLLIQRQAQDWEEGLFSVEVINTMLNTGSRWANIFELPEIYIGDYKIPMESSGRFTGNVTVTLPASTVSGNELLIKRKSPTPAWGGIVTQFVAPMESVKAISIPDLKIEKEYRLITTDETGIKAEKLSEFKIGDKVRVTMIITCGRDLDYVALTDERPSCIEPEDQLSGYRSSDGIGFYREVKNSETDMYFYFLPKGKHMISYDCRVSEAGTFASGIAILQSQYAPLITSHSKGEIIKIN